MDNLRIDDFMEYTFISKVTFSPDGKHMAYVIKKADREKNDYSSYIRLMDTDTGIITDLTGLGKESSFIFDDDETLLMSLNRRKEDEPEKHERKTSFYRMRINGGEPAPAFELPYDVSEIRKLEEGKYLFTSRIDLLRPDMKHASDEEKEDYDDYHVLTEIPYWEDGGGFISGFRTHLYEFDEKDNKVTEITKGKFDVTGFSCNNGRVIYTGCTFDSLRPLMNGLYEYVNGSCVPLIAENRLIIGRAEPAESGMYLTAHKEGETSGWGTPSLYFFDDHLIPIEGELPEIGGTAGTDCYLGGAHSFKAVGDTLYFTALEGYDTCFYSADMNGIRKLFKIDLASVQGFDIFKKDIMFIGMKKGHLQEIWRSDMEGSLKKMTSYNDMVLETKYVAEPEYMGFTDSDGVKIDGWLLRPEGVEEGKKYPAILDIHGGPRGAYGEAFFHEMQYWANEGYFVFFCNPRGSSGKGDDFADIRTKYGTIDYQDLMEFTDHILEQVPEIDRDMVGVTGGSYGGWMTNWIIGHTDRFRAAASQRSFSNWLSDFSASEIGPYFDVDEVGGLPWEDPMRLWENSPAAYADKIVTPTLFIHSLNDHNCPLSESMQIFAAMRYRGIDARACLFEKEGHELSRSGKPRHRLRRLKEITRWMDRYLKKGLLFTTSDL